MDARRMGLRLAGALSALIALPMPCWGAEDAASVDFERQVKPIFKRHCYACHGPGKQEAGLRLDARRFAQKGGTSGQPLLTSDLANNEIYQRVTSDDPLYRMPRLTAPLSADEVEILTRWVAAGCPWPDEDDGAAAGHGREHEATVIWTALRFLKRHQYDVGLLLLFALGVLAAEWLKGQGVRRLRGVRTSHYLVVLLTGICVVGGVRWNEQAREWAARENAQVAPEGGTQQAHHATDVAAIVEEIYGNPPRPFHPGHPKRLSGTYYRGNCERNPKLNNLGNYRTATMHLALIDDLHRPVKVGDDVAGRTLFLRLDIERSPYTSEELFSERIMKSVFLSQHYTVLPEADRDDRTGLVVLEPQKRWRADYSLTLSPQADQHRQGLVYVYKGNDASWRNGRVHYGIVFDLVVRDGKLTAESEVWMNSLFWEPNLARPQPGKVPLTEWFNHFPIPELREANTNDPRLIGIGDYVRELNQEPKPKSPSAN